MSGARSDGTFTKDQRLLTLRRILCDGMPVRAAAKLIGCSEASAHAWKRNVFEANEARDAGPVDGSSDEQGSDAQPGDFLADLPAIGAESPDDPSPSLLVTLANCYAVTVDLDRLDDVAGWPRGSIARWFESRDPEDVARVAVLRRARALMDVHIIKTLIDTRNATALAKIAAARSPTEWTAPEGDEGGTAEGLGLEAIEAELMARQRGKG